jgi:hypothetical protein
VVVLWLVAVAFVFHGRRFSMAAAAYDGVPSGERLTTVLTVVPHYARLLFVPWSLSADYGPQVIPPAQHLDAGVLAGGLLCIAIALGVAVAWRRAKPVAFALAWIPIVLAPVSNVFVVSGITLAERTLYLASAGVCFLGGLATDALLGSRKVIVLATATALVSVFALRTWTRTPIWRDDRIFLLTLLETHPESYRAHWVAGRVLASAGRLDDAAREMAVARSLFRRDRFLFRESAEVALARGAPDEARALADSAQTIAPADSSVAAFQARLRSLSR